MSRRSAVATLAAVSVLIAGCGSSSGTASARKTGTTVGHGAPTTTTVRATTLPPHGRSFRDPLPAGTTFDAGGWNNITFSNPQLVPASKVDATYTEFPPPTETGLVYVSFTVSGTNARPGPSSLYELLGTCYPSGSLGSKGIVRTILPMLDRTGVFDPRTIYTDQPKVLPGVTQTATAVYFMDPNDTGLEVLMNSKACGPADLFVAMPLPQP